MREPQIDPVAVAVALAALMFAPDVASIIGPYFVIVVASTVGASFALARRPSDSRWSALAFFLRVNGLSVLLTWAIAAFLNSHVPSLEKSVLFAPVALGLGFIGDRWPLVLTWVGERIRMVIDLMIKTKGGGQ